MTADTMALPTDGEVRATEAVDALADQPAPIGLFQRADPDIVKQIRLWWKESADAQADVRRKRDNEWAHLAGHQWDDKDLEGMKTAKRPALTLNLLQAMMAAVEGQERNNRQELKLYGENEDADTAAFALNRLIKWVMYQCGGEFALSRQFRACSSVGEGWVGFEVDFFENPEGMIRVAYVPEGESYSDPLSQEPTGRDMRYYHRVRMYSPDEMEARWPGSIAKLKTNMVSSDYGVESDGKGFRDVYLDKTKTNGPKYYDAKKTQYAVLETWWTQIEPGVVVVNEQTGFLDEHTPEEFDQMKAARVAEQQAHVAKLMDGTFAMEQQAQHAQMQQQAREDAAQQGLAAGASPDQLAAAPDPAAAVPPPPMPPMPPPLDGVPRQVRRVYQAFTSFETLLQKAACDMPTVKRVPYVPARAMWDQHKGEWFGLLRSLLDMQKQHNVEQSAMVQLVQLMPKASWMAPKGAFHNRQEWEQKIATPGSMFEYNGRIGKPEQIKTPDIPRHMAEMAMSRPEAMRAISGVNIEMTGIRQGSDPGIVFEQRSKAALTVLAPIFDNYRESKIEVGKLLIAYIQRYVSVGRKIRVLGKEGAKYVEMTQDMAVGRYDVIVDESDASVNDQIATLNILQTTLPMLVKEGVPVPPNVIDLLPMPPDLKAEFKRYLAWSLMIAGQSPPDGWQPGMPDPRQPMLPPPGVGAPPGPGPSPVAPQG